MTDGSSLSLAEVSEMVVSNSDRLNLLDIGLTDIRVEINNTSKQLQEHADREEQLLGKICDFLSDDLKANLNQIIELHKDAQAGLRLIGMVHTYIVTPITKIAIAIGAASMATWAFIEFVWKYIKQWVH